VSATASNGYSFGGWTGSGTGFYSGGNNPASITMNGPVTQSASFVPVDPPAQSILAIIPGNDGSVTLTYATTPGFSYHVETTTNLGPSFWATVPGSPTNATGSSVTFTVPTQAGSGPFFYRTVSP